MLVLLGVAPFSVAQQQVVDPAVVHKESVGSEADLAQDLTNPLADLMTIPIQVTYDSDIGPEDKGSRYTTNIQPVIPISISDDWNVITRTIIPIISQDDIFTNAGSQSGLGDINLSLFFSPTEKTSGGVIWGVGPVFLLPTADDDLLGADKWAAGAGFVALTFAGNLTYGMLGNHMRSFAGDNDRADIELTFLQPFAAYTWPSAWTASVSSEVTYNHEAHEWGVPLQLSVSKLVFLGGKLPVSFMAGVGQWVESTDIGAEGIRFRLQANIVLPKPF